MKHRLIAVAGAGVALAATGGGLAVAAQSGKAAKPEPPAAVFRTHLADRLHVSESDLKAATKGAAEDTVDALQADGRLTADRASKLKARIEKSGTAGFATLAPVHRAAAAREAALKAMATALALDPRELLEALRSGDAPSKVIADHGGDVSAVRAAVTKALRDVLQKGVDAGRLTADQADDRAAKAAERLTGDQPLPAGRGRAKAGGAKKPPSSG
jgi:hypothetical protein